MSTPVDKTNQLDVVNAERGVWLVKVPKYMSNEWQKAKPSTEIGRLRITKGSDGKTEILFDVAESVIEKANKDDKETKIPREHKFAISDISHQHLAVFSYSKDEKTGTTKTKLEGNVVQRGECRPTGDLLYMGLKRQAFVKSQEPTRKVISLDRAVNNSFRPVSVHKVDAEFEKKKKAEGKKARDDKDKVVDVLMTAFQKHQYYALKDLAKITKQPIQYLKEILNEHCIYNAKNPHKNTWELKPEYRHYEQPESSNN